MLNIGTLSFITILFSHAKKLQYMEALAILNKLLFSIWLDGNGRWYTKGWFWGCRFFLFCGGFFCLFCAIFITPHVLNIKSNKRTAPLRHSHQSENSHCSEWHFFRPVNSPCVSHLAFLTPDYPSAWGRVRISHHFLVGVKDIKTSFLGFMQLKSYL